MPLTIMRRPLSQRSRLTTAPHRGAGRGKCERLTIMEKESRGGSANVAAVDIPRQPRTLKPSRVVRRRRPGRKRVRPPGKVRVGAVPGAGKPHPAGAGCLHRTRMYLYSDGEFVAVFLARHRPRPGRFATAHFTASKSNRFSQPRVTFATAIGLTPQRRRFSRAVTGETPPMSAAASVAVIPSGRGSAAGRGVDSVSLTSEPPHG